MTHPFTRRQLLRRAALGGAAFAFPTVLAACGGGGIEGEAADTGAAPAATGATTAPRELAESITIANWPLYIDTDDETNERPTLNQFTEETGVRVEYLEEVNDNEEWFGRFQAQLSQGQDIDRDITVLTDWMAARLVKLGYLQKLDKSAIPNAENLVDSLTSPGWDPNREYSMPWQSGLTGIAYNPELTGAPVTTIEQLLTDPKLKGKVTCLTDIASTMSLVMQANGDDPTAVTAEAFDRAIAMLQEGVDSGQIRRFTGNDYTDDLASGNVWACIAWSGDIVQLKLDNPHLEFVIPDDGGDIFTDNMLVPIGGDVFTASTFMNFVYDPAVAAQIEAYVNYICPVQGAKEELAKLDPELAENELIFPSEETLAKVKIFDAEAADTPEFREKFQALVGA